MKFTGLILICATSCLALILPAIGVVRFQRSPVPPPAFGQTNTPFLASATGTNTAISSQQEFLPTTRPTAFPASPLHGNPFPQGNASLRELGHVNAELENAQLGNAQLGNKASALSENSNSRLGLGVWFLLAPVCLIGLAMWTFAPNPSGVKPKFSRSSAD